MCMYAYIATLIVNLIIMLIIIIMIILLLLLLLIIILLIHGQSLGRAAVHSFNTGCCGASN